MTLKPCLDCGELTTTGSRCPGHTRAVLAHIDQRRGTANERGYTERWARLSRKARRLQPFCGDCGRSGDLTLDHLPGSWERVAAGKALRPGVDVEVVCMRCNIARGAVRGEAATRGGNRPRPNAQTPHPGKLGVTNRGCM